MKLVGHQPKQHLLSLRPLLRLLRLSVKMFYRLKLVRPRNQVKTHYNRPYRHSLPSRVSVRFLFRVNWLRKQLQQRQVKQLLPLNRQFQHLRLQQPCSISTSTFQPVEHLPVLDPVVDRCPLAYQQQQIWKIKYDHLFLKIDVLKQSSMMFYCRSPIFYME